MAVHIRCQCGKEFAIPEKRAAKPFKCYVCRREVLCFPEPASSPATSEPEVGIVPEAPGGGPSLTSPRKPVPASEEPSSPVAPGWDGREAALAFAAERMQAGVSSPDVYSELVARGFDSELAKEALEEMREVGSRLRREAAHKNMMFGALWCISGLAITLVTYALALNMGGGKYLLAWGAMLGGACQFLWGVGQLANKE